MKVYTSSYSRSALHCQNEVQRRRRPLSHHYSSCSSPRCVFARHHMKVYTSSYSRSAPHCQNAVRHSRQKSEQQRRRRPLSHHHSSCSSPRCVFARHQMKVYTSSYSPTHGRSSSSSLQAAPRGQTRKQQRQQRIPRHHFRVYTR